MENIMRKVTSSESGIINDSSMINIITCHDGSITNLIRSVFGEPVEVECLGQGYRMINRNKWNDIDYWEKILQRNVYLTGRKSQVCYLYATSLIRTQYLDKDIKIALLEGKKGIGELIQEYKIETFREIIESKLVSHDSIQHVFPTKEKILLRVYKLYMNGMPLMLISEYFSHDFYKYFM